GTTWATSCTAATRGSGRLANRSRSSCSPRIRQRASLAFGQQHPARAHVAHVLAEVRQVARSGNAVAGAFAGGQLLGGHLEIDTAVGHADGDYIAVAHL